MRKKLFWIATACLFLIFAAEDWAFYRPGTKKLEQLNQTIGESQSQVMSRQLPAEKLEKVKELIRQNTLEGQPSPDGESYTTQSLGRLTAILKELNIELLSFTPGDARQEELFVVSPFEIELRCGYHQFGKLLDTIDKSPDFIVIRKLQISMVQDEPLAKLSVEVYLFKKDQNV
jgi:Tfp pilus assembly protein PilO